MAIEHPVNLTASIRTNELACSPQFIRGGLTNENAPLDRNFVLASHGVQLASGITAVIAGQPMLSGASPEDEFSGNDLLDLYARYGNECAAHLSGTWAFLIADPLQQRILLATDRMGRLPIYFAVQDHNVVASATIPDLRKLSPSRGVDSQNLYNYVYFHMIPAPGSVWSGMQKLRAGEQLEVTAAGWNTSRYWTPSFRETAADKTLRHTSLQQHLKGAVQRSQSNTGKTGAFLSGGLDSSTVAGMLSELQGGSCDAYAIGFDAEGYDEMAYARITAEHFGIRLHEYYVTPDDVVTALPAVAASFDEPFGNSSALPAYFCARMAASDGITTLLAGDGGDELFAGNERYAKQKVFDLYRNLPAWLQRAVITPAVSSLPGILPGAGKAKSYITQANLPLPDRLQYYSFLEQISPETVFNRGLLHEVDVNEPLRVMRETFHTPKDASALNRMLFLDWQMTLADNDLRKVSQACRLAGVKVRYPMLDDELVAFSTTLPTRWKLPGNRLRDFYKQALSGWLPEATIKKAKHGFGLPFGVWMKDHKPLQEMAYENILKLKSRNIFQADFLEEAIAQHRSGHASYFGELIWVLTVLEIWLQANQPEYRHE
ncbi:MAG TPA: asparagine synthase [Halieaceae bacterium]|jgi:asparagine synthase (glutamine-hydrolysing)|uniref:asparagine synthetase B family protein n=1 Tax=Haliea sp. TaxID=1932666 RepID=UPI000C46BB3F|nr:asparagine synthase-related protein [Haliea sp.]HBQ42046.1 asparagine synthase [Halieaceae bacterium]MAD62055.1 asparagine synthase [Haliea sp.]MAY93942.1 asparagine synthase [Haliea sp.]MBK41701.1 asparagine synthase [Haliea sp.]MBP70648.1 asparagine synthase [Haliea sp.]|tara:strand:+ start:5288 stop:7096 length:1809 start_codon:yes stop_codon:yes gene_type:complete